MQNLVLIMKMVSFLGFGASGSRMRHFKFWLLGFCTSKEKFRKMAQASQSKAAARALSRNFAFDVKNPKRPNFKCNFTGFRSPKSKTKVIFEISIKICSAWAQTRLFDFLMWHDVNWLECTTSYTLYQPWFDQTWLYCDPLGYFSLFLATGKILSISWLFGKEALKLNFPL